MKAKTTPPAQKEVAALRMQRLLGMALDVSLGTVWRVREHLWMQTFGRGYDQNSTRLWHPGVSLRQTPPAALYEMVPMLHGTTDEQGPVVVHGLTLERGPRAATSFGKIIRPGQFSVQKIVRPGAEVDQESLSGPWYARSSIMCNMDKPRFTCAETQELKSWAASKNLL